MAINIDVLIKLGVLIFCTGCAQPSMSPPDRLIYIEGKELTSGRFGDLVVLGPNITGKYVLNKDSFYDSWPVLIDSSQAIFLSKRREGDKQLGLT